MPRYAAVLDACVLVPVALADTLLRIAEKGLYRPLWSEEILAEAREAIEEIHPDIESGIFLPDEDDRHVVAAAHTRRPPLTPQDLATQLGRAGVPDFADEVLRRMSGPLNSGT